VEGPCASAREVFCTCSFECLIFKRQCSFLRALTEHIEYIKDEEISVMVGLYVSCWTEDNTIGTRGSCCCCA
jgi:hypothetical protein